MTKRKKALGLLKTILETEKMLVTGIFSFSHYLDTFFQTNKLYHIGFLSNLLSTMAFNFDKFCCVVKGLNIKVGCQGVNK